MEQQGQHIIYESNTVGCDFFIGHYALIRNNNVIGNHVSVGSYTEIAHTVIIEDNVRIHSKCFICEYSILRKGCWLGPGVRLINDLYPNSNNPDKKSPIICENAKIGSSSIIMPGVIVGKNALVGAGSIVTEDVPPHEVWCGNPAKFLKNICDLEQYNIKNTI